MGRRLGEHTKENTKCMVKVNGVRLIDRMLSQLAVFSVERVVIVVGYKGRELREYIDERYSDRLRIEYVCNPVYDTTNNIYSLFLAKEHLQRGDTLLLESDLIYEDSILELAINSLHPNVALVSAYQPWMDGTMVRIDADGNITAFIPKADFKYSEVSTYYKTVNIYRFSERFSREVYVPFLEAYCSALGRNEYYEQVLSMIIHLNRKEIKALPVGDLGWYEIDDVQDLDIAEAIFAPDEEKLSRYTQRGGGYWRFETLLDFSNPVNPFFPTVRLREELRASFDPLVTTYPSGMGVHALLAGKYFGVRAEYTVLGNGVAELLAALMRTISGRLGVVCPTLEEYANRCKPEQLEVFVPQNVDFMYTAKDLMVYFEGRNLGTLLLINPDNPSGNFISLADVVELLGWCRARGIRLVLDESFVDFSEGFQGNSLLSDAMLVGYPNLCVVKSISKSYGVPGLRLGVLASSDRGLVDAIMAEASMWNINSFAEYYMQIFGKYTSDYVDACARLVVERERFRGLLNGIPFLRVIPSQANYFLCEVFGAYTSRGLTEVLLGRSSILVEDCSTKRGFEGRSYIRIAVRSVEDNDRLVQVLGSLSAK